MKVCLVNAPYLERFSRPQRSPGVIKSGTLYFPYWLAFAAGILERAGFEVLLLDAVAEGLSREDCLERIKSGGFTLTVVDTSTPSIASDLAFCRCLKDAGAGGRLTLVGTHASAEHAAILKNNPQVDYVAVGEYEITLLELAMVLDRGEEPDSVAGLARRENKTAVLSGQRELIEDLDGLPWLARVYKKHLPIERYRFSLARHPMLMLITGRGCPNRCFFCVYSQTMHGRRYRFRSPEDVVGELAYVAAELPRVKEIVFEDDTFTANPARVEAICRLMLDRRVRLPWFANIRVNTSYETLALMKAAGLRRCAVGFESGDQAILDAMGKGTTIDQAVAFKKNCDTLGILVHGCFMFGFPGETRQTMEKTFAFAKSLRCDSAQFYPVFPYPGTEAYAWFKSGGYLRGLDFPAWLDASGQHACVFDLPGLPAEDIDAFSRDCYRRYYSSPGYLLRKAVQCLTRPEEAARNVKGGLSLLASLVRRRTRPG